MRTADSMWVVADAAGCSVSIDMELVRGKTLIGEDAGSAVALVAKVVKIG